jgi:hypothetical protein
LSVLRKKWADDIKLKKERDDLRNKIERQRIVLQQAVNLREKNITVAENIRRDKALKAKKMSDYRLGLGS